MARSRAQPVGSLVGLMSDQLDDDTMSDEIGREAPDSNQENFIPRASISQKSKPVMANGRVRQAVNKKGSATKPRAAAKKPAKREIIEEEPEEAEDVDELESVEIAEEEAQKTKGQPAQKINAPSIERNTVIPSVEEFGHSRPPRVNGTNHAKPQPFHQLQSDGFNGNDFEDDIIPSELPGPVLYQHTAQVRGRSTSQQPIPSIFSRHRRAGSTSSNEGKNPDPALRRKLGEVSKKFETLEIRYRKLQDVGVVEAKTNFDKLKTSSDGKARIATELINSLKKELASQKAASQQAQSLQDEAESQTTALTNALAAAKKEISDLKSEQTDLKQQLASAKSELSSHSTASRQLAETKTQITVLTKQLTESQTEQTNLQAKLAAARAASTDRHIPGSAVKGAKAAATKAATTNEVNAAMNQAQAINNLYSDLTGLLINHVDRRDEKQDIFNCIQTGRNGTLHFKLSVSTDTNNESYDETDFQYLPQLDAARDGKLMELLPYYLVEDISFQRKEAAKFYSRVFDVLTRKYEDEGEEEEDVE